MFFKYMFSIFGILLIQSCIEAKVSGANPSNSATYIDEAGQILPSLFEGVRPTIRSRTALRINAKKSTSGCLAQRKTNGHSGVFKLVDDPGDCRSGCAGAYMVTMVYVCYQGCTGSYRWHYSDVLIGWEGDGYMYSGYTCGICKQCAELSCYNGYDPL